MEIETAVQIYVNIPI